MTDKAKTMVQNLRAASLMDFGEGQLHHTAADLIEELIGVRPMQATFQRMKIKRIPQVKLWLTPDDWKLGGTDYDHVTAQILNGVVEHCVNVHTYARDETQRALINTMTQYIEHGVGGESYTAARLILDEIYGEAA